MKLRFGTESIAEIHIRKNALHSWIGEPFIKKIINKRRRRLIMYTFGPSPYGAEGNYGVENKENRKSHGKYFARFIRNFQNQFRYSRINAFYPHNAENSPEKRIEKTYPPVKIEWHTAVIPRGRPEYGFLRPREDIFYYAADRHSAYEWNGSAAVALTVKH